MSELTNTFSDIADAIRNRNGESATIKPIEMAGKINSMCKAYGWTVNNSGNKYLDLNASPEQDTTIKQLDINTDVISISQITDYDHYQKTDASNFSLIKDLSLLDKWTEVYANNEARLTDITYCSNLNLYVAVGRMGRILHSSDGVNWTNSSSVTGRDLFRVKYFSDIGLIVAVGSYGEILTSSDGINWTQYSTGISLTLNGIAYSSALNLIVVVGASGKIFTSSDGINWTQQSSGVTYNISDVIMSSDNSMFVAGGNNHILVSTDGINWADSGSISSLSITRILYVPFLHQYVAVGNSRVSTSTDLVNWNINSSASSSTLYGLSYIEELGIVIAVGATNDFITSTDALTWTERHTNTSVSSWYGVLTPSKDLAFFAGGTGSSAIIAMSTSSDTDVTTYTRNSSVDLSLW